MKNYFSTESLKYLATSICDLIDTKIAKLSQTVLGMFSQVDATMETFITKQECKTEITNEIASILDNAPQDFDTLKEVADWIESDKTRAAGLTIKVSNLEATVENLPKIYTGIELPSSNLGNNGDIYFQI